MTKTEHYQLNQWAAEDRVLRTDFNEDNAKIDAALESVRAGAETALNSKAAEVQTALEGKLRTVQSALDEHKQEAQAALDAKAEELQSAITSGDSSLRSSLSSTSSSLSTLRTTVNNHAGDTTLHAFVKLGSVTATGSGASFSSSLSGYSMLLLDCHFQDGDHRVKVTFNGSAELTLFNGSLALYHAVAFLFPVGSSAVGCSARAVSDGGELAGGGTASGVSWPSVRTMSFSTAGKDATITIYGIRK